jgi:formate hydrogenlyase subunit 4
MIHEAMILEYSGKRLALIEWASYAKLFGFVVLGANLFFPWGLLPSAVGAGSAFFSAIFAISAKVLLFALGIAVLESVIAKLRIFRVPNFIATAFVLGAVAIALTVV